MNAAHLHLVVNHLPVFGVLFGLGLAAIGRWRRSPQLVKAGLALFVVAGFGAGAAYLSGQRAEDIVEPLAGVSESLIEDQEEAALWSLVGAGALGLVSLIGLLRHRRRDIPGWLATLALGLGLITAGSMAWTANLGGGIRHSEIRPETAAPAGEDEERGEGAAHPEDHGAALLPLIDIMRGLGDDMAIAAGGLWRDDRAAIAEAAERVAGHPNVTPEEREAIQGALADGFADFVKHDQIVHNTAQLLAEQARGGAPMAALHATVAEIQQACVSCHDRYRAPIVGLRATKPTPTQPVQR